MHLGTPGCQAAHLADFLKRNTCDQLFLVGDIIDGWRLKSGWYWPQEHSNVIRRILTQAKRGAQVTYVAGNHDEFLRKFVRLGLDIGNIRVVDEHVHETADGRKLLVLHGDRFDIVTRYHRWLAVLGHLLYDVALRFNQHFNLVRRLIGMRYWSLSAFAKDRIKIAVNVISGFEEAVASECRRRKLDGAICGHIHHAEIRPIEDVVYHNCGDWVESCTALVEDANGQIEIIRWVDFDQLHAPLKRPLPLQHAA